MLYDLTSTHKDFRSFEFTKGLNLILAEKVGDVTSTNTSNSCGKTSLTDGIYSLFGGNVKGGAFGKAAFGEIPLAGHLDVGDQRVQVTRVPKRTKIHVKASDLERLLNNPQVRLQREAELDVDRWKKVLGYHWFNVPYGGFDLGPSAPIGGRLIRYVARRQEAEGMKDPTKTFSTERAVDAITSIAYLLGAPWRQCSAYGETLAQSNAVTKLKAAGEEGSRLFQHVLGIGVNLDDQIRELVKEVEGLEEAAQQQDDAMGDEAVRQELDRAQQRVREVASQLSQAKRSEKAISRALENHPRDFDAKAWVRELPQAIRPILNRRVEEVQVFHDAVVANRWEYLEGHRRTLQREISALEEQHHSAVAGLHRTFRRYNNNSWVVSIHGRAAELAEKKGRLQHLQEASAARERMQAKQAELKELRKRDKKGMQVALNESPDRLESLNSEFNNIVQSVYNSDAVSGSLTFTAKPKQLQISSAIEGAGDSGAGVNQVNVWAMDLLIKHYEKDRGFNCGILVHDSHLFDPIDEDQRPILLEVARRRSLSEGWQYIVTMNEHAFGEVGLSSELESCVNPVKLNDSETGGLFGFKDGPTRSQGT